MYIARVDSQGRTEWARIGRVSFSKTGRTVYYDRSELHGIGRPWSVDIQTAERFHIQTARAEGLDRSEGRRGGSFPVGIVIRS